MKIEFFKYQGTGNDFILVDNRTGLYNNIDTQAVKKICNRNFGVGGDGFIMLNKKTGYSFDMQYYNPDGSSSMCGNGGRCMVKFARDLGILEYSYTFSAVDGDHEAEIDNHGLVRLKMNDVTSVELHAHYAVLNTGSPHYVRFSDDVNNIDVLESGREVRYSKHFKEEGINVNFTEVIDDDTIFVRTYERGVEDETLSCGTGVTACALVHAHNDRGFNRVNVKTPGGKLCVEFNKEGDGRFENIWLIGPADYVFKGEMEV